LHLKVVTAVEQDTKKKYKINIDELYNITKKIKLKKHDTISILYQDLNQDLEIEIYKNNEHVGTVPLVNPDEGDKIHHKIRLKSEFDFDINTKTLTQAVDVIKKYTDLDIKITITNRPVVIYQNEEENHGIKKYDKIMIVHNFGAWQGRPDKTIKSRYDVEYLSDILLAHKLFEYVNLKIATDYPLTISSKTINDDVKFKHFLAPRVPTE
jgi:hypothetical protein